MPLLDIVSIIVLSLFGSATTGAKLILKTVLNNPLIQACSIELAINLSIILKPNSILQTLYLIGRATLGVEILIIRMTI